MKSYLLYGAVFAALIVVAPNCVQAAVVLTNGSFEDIGVQYNPALGGIHEATGWTNLTPLTIQAASVPKGVEGTPADGATGDRFLRLVADEGNPNNRGTIAQLLGTMTAGETYTITADALAAPGAGVLWGATASFVNEISFTPGVVYASQTVSDLADGVAYPGAFSFSYLATPADDGQPLVLMFQAPELAAGQANRGGIDNVQLTVTPVPEPSSLGLSAVGLTALAACRRSRRRNVRS